MKKELPKSHKGLPLIDFGVTLSPKIIRGTEFHERLMWLIYLRWLAVAGLIIGLPAGQLLMGVHLLTPPLLILTLILSIHNLFSHIITRKYIGYDDRKLYISANGQISIDLLILTLLIHFSGGVENPFIISYVYHMIISAILLTAAAAYSQALWASFLLGLQTALTQLGFINQPHLQGFLGVTFTQQNKFVWSFYGILVATLFLAVYLTYSISKELKAREKRLQETNELLREKDRLKSEYVLALSHDLQQPLVAVQTNLKVVLDGYTGKVNLKSREMIIKSERRVEQLLEVIRDLLRLSKITSSRVVEKIEIDIAEILREIGRRANGLVQDKKQILKLELPSDKIPIIANFGMLRQAFWNLIENAIKYTPQGGQIIVAASAKDHIIQVAVEDTGIGIPAEEIESIFGDFYRAKNAIQYDEHGTGLGLAIVKHAIEAHGGRISVHSPRHHPVDGIHQGTRFEIILPQNLER